MKIDLAEIINKINHQRIFLVGDFLADEYIYGHTAGVAREAPIVVVKYNKTKVVLGGAGNALKNCLRWGGKTTAFGLVGEDHNGDEIRKQILDAGTPESYIYTARGRRTPTKTRVFAGQKRGAEQQIFRLDADDSSPHTIECQKMLSEAFVGAAEATPPDLILVSDYGLNTITGQLSYDIFKTSVARRSRVMVDSKYPKLNLNGHAAQVMNMDEFSLISNRDACLEEDWVLRSEGNEFLQKTRLGNLLLTRGNKGVALFGKNTPAAMFPAYGDPTTKDIFGTGDVVFVVFSRTLAASKNAEFAAIAANIAGSLSVAESGAVTVSLKNTLERAEEVYNNLKYGV